MLKKLTITNTGPTDAELVFGNRLNLITGDNGLGKSFLLDIAWWAMTRKWPAEVNPRLTAGKVALPTDKKQKAAIGFSFTGVSKTKEAVIYFEPRLQNWNIPRGRPANPGIVFYAMADGSFAVWDPARNYWKTNGGESPVRPPAYVFSPKEVWDGLQREDGTWLCNGLIRDWASWQKEKGRAFDYLTAVLSALSPSSTEQLQPGELTRISLDDVRDMPTLRMPYGQDVAVVHASSGMRRIIALSYFLVWCWEEHRKAKELLGEEPETKIVFLIDEVEAHLHPKWQRTAIPSLMKVMGKLMTSPDVQLIAATHSPLVMASVEPTFDAKQDAWFDLDLMGKQVELTRRNFVKYGNAENWLTSEAFDLKSTRPEEYALLVQRAAALLNEPSPAPRKIKSMHDELVRELNPKDDFLFRWRAICERKGWLK